MKLNTNTREQGFTLIELIMVIVIMGILAAVVVPKFFDLEVKTHDKVELAVIGNIRAGLLTYSVNELILGNGRTFPASTSAVFGEILDVTPDNWSYNEATDAANKGSIMYIGRGADTSYWAYSTGTGTYTIGARATDVDPQD